MFRLSKEDVRELRKCCLADDNGFDHLGTVIPNSNGNNNVFIKNQFGNDAPVLAIAHIDTAVFGEADRNKFLYSKEKQMVVCGSLDDRLGIWALTQKLPKFIGHRGYDILLTTGEESGRSSAKDFSVEAEKYNWIFELDRRGCDAVHYGFTSKPWLTALTDYGWDMSEGSFSDISMLEHGTVSAVNFGIGYNNAHSENCYAFMEQVTTQLMRVAAFYRMYDGSRFKHTYKAPSPTKWNDDYYPNYGKNYTPYTQKALPLPKKDTDPYDNVEICDDCAAPLGQFDKILCKECQEDYELTYNPVRYSAGDNDDVDKHGDYVYDYGSDTRQGDA